MYRKTKQLFFDLLIPKVTETEKGAGKEKRKKWEAACFRPILNYHCKRRIILSSASRGECLASQKLIFTHTHITEKEWEKKNIVKQ